MQDFEAVVFDMDGLMLDTERISVRAWARAEEATGHRMPEGFYDGIIGQSMTECHRRLRAAMPADCEVDAFISEANRHYHHMLTAGKIPIKVGLIEILDALKEANKRLAVATSTNIALARRKLDSVGILDRFEVMVGGDEVAHSKPDPAIYKMALERLGVAADRAFALEDSPNGVRAASAAGIRTILVPDLAPVNDEIRGIAWRTCVSLHEARALLLGDIETDAASRS